MAGKSSVEVNRCLMARRARTLHWRRLKELAVRNRGNSAFPSNDNLAISNTRSAYDTNIKTSAPQHDLIVAHEEGAVLYGSEPDLEWFYLEALSVYRFATAAEREAFIAGYRGAQRRVKEA